MKVKSMNTETYIGDSKTECLTPLQISKLEKRLSGVMSDYYTHNTDEYINIGDTESNRLEKRSVPNEF